MADLSKSTNKKPVSLNHRHHRLLQDLSAPPKQPQSATPSGLSLQLFFVLILQVLIYRVLKSWIDLFGLQRRTRKKRVYSMWSSKDDVVFAKLKQRMIASLISVESLILILLLVISLNPYLDCPNYLIFSWLAKP